MLAEEALIGSSVGHLMSNLAGPTAPPTHLQLAPSIGGNLVKARSEMHDIPTKKSKPLDDASAYQLEYQYQYQSLMYAHCAQQQHVGQMSAFRPWAPPKSFLHAYNAAAVAALCLSQEPPVLQNPERVVRSTDRERFERTYQPNVALAPRKTVLTKEMDRERERERIEREREREIERVRERERERERDREREREKERELELQHLQQSQRHENFTNLRDSDVHVHIKQERANTPCDLSPMTSPPTNLHISSLVEEQQQQQQQLLLQHPQHMQRHNNGVLHNDDETLPLSLSLHQQQRHQHQQQQHKHQHQPPTQQQPLSLKSNNQNHSTSPQHAHQQRQQHQHLPQQSHRITQQLIHNDVQQLRHSPAHSITPPINAAICNASRNQQQHENLSCSPVEISSSTEITSSTSPIPPTNCLRNNNLYEKQQHMPQTYQQQQLHATNKMLATTTAVTTTINSRIRINKNLIQQSNIMRTPTPPPPPSTTTTPSATLPPPNTHHQHVHHQQQQQQHYDYYKQRDHYYNNYSTQPATVQPLLKQQQPATPTPQQQQQQQQATCLNLSTHKINNNNNNKNVINKYTRQGNIMQHQSLNNGIISAHQYQKHQHMGSGEFELSTDTDDESINGEPDSSVNMLPHWEMAVEALRDTRPKDRERVLHLLQRLLHDNQQYRYTNLQLNDLLQKRDTQVRELNEQLLHCRRQIDDLQLNVRIQHQQQQQQQQQQQHQQEELRVPLKKSLRRDPLLTPPTAIEASVLVSTTHHLEDNNNTQQNALQVKRFKSENTHDYEQELEIKRENLDVKSTAKIEKSEEVQVVNECKTEQKNIVQNKVTELISTLDINQKNSELSGRNVKLFHRIKENSMEDEEIDEEEEKYVEAPQSRLATATTPISPETAATAGQLFDNSNSSDAASMKQAQMCASNVVAQITAANEADDEDVEADVDIDVDADAEDVDVDIDDAKPSDTTTTTEAATVITTAKTSNKELLLLKKKKKKKERKERKEKRRAAAAAAAAVIETTNTAAPACEAEATTPNEVPVVAPRPMATKASKKITPATPPEATITTNTAETTNCDLAEKLT